MDIADPTRAKLRMDNELPRCTKSNTESDDARRPTPNTEYADPNRPNARIDSELPR